MVPKVEDDYGQDASEFFKELTSTPRLKANVDYRKGNVLYLTLYTRSSIADGSSSLNAEMVKNGFAQVEKRVPKKFADLASRLRAQQEQARRRRAGIYEYGDYDLDEEK